MNEEYQKGVQIGELMGEIKSLRVDLQEYIKKQDLLNEKQDKRLTLVEGWIQTTTGKVVVLTAIFGIVGSLCYVGINWALSHLHITR